MGVLAAEPGRVTGVGVDAAHIHRGAWLGVTLSISWVCLITETLLETQGHLIFGKKSLRLSGRSRNPDPNLGLEAPWGTKTGAGPWVPVATGTTAGGRIQQSNYPVWRLGIHCRSTTLEGTLRATKVHLPVRIACGRRLSAGVSYRHLAR